MRRLPVLAALAAILAAAPLAPAVSPSPALPSPGPGPDPAPTPTRPAALAAHPVALSPARRPTPLAPRADFLPNRGQWPAEVLFATPLGTPSVIVLTDRIVVQLFDVLPAGAGDPPDHMAIMQPEPALARGVNLVLRMAPLTDFAARGTAPLPGRMHAYLGRGSDAWAEDLPCFAEVRWEGPDGRDGLVLRRDAAGVDLTLVGPRMREVLPEVEGGRLRIEADGRLVVTTDLGTTPLGRVRHLPEPAEAPPPPGLTGPGPGVGLPGDEPVPEYATFVGGPRTDRVLDVALVEDPPGTQHMFFCGRITAPVMAPLVPGPFETEAQGGLDGFVGRLTPRGDAFVWASFVGGDLRDELTGLDVRDDGAGGLVTHLSGFTDSADFPVQGAGGGLPLQDTFAGETDAAALCLRDDGSLDWSTYLGGSLSAPGTGLDVAWDVELDDDGNIYLAGFTTSEDFPVTAGVYSDDINGPLPSTLSDGFVSKLTPDGSAYVWSTYLSGDKCDEAADIEVDAAGRVFATGLIDSDAFTDFGTVPGAQPVAFPAIPGDNAYTLTLNPSGTGILHGTFLAGEGSDGGRALTVHGDDVWIVGFSNSSLFPVVNALDPVFDGSQEAFASKIDWTTGVVAFSTFLGGSASDVGWAVARAPGGDVWVAGSTASPDFNGLTNDHDPHHGGQDDAFVIRLDENGTLIEMGTLVGGAGDDLAYALAIDGTGTRALLGGTTSSVDFPAHAARALDPIHNGGRDGFLARLDLP